MKSVSSSAVVRRINRKLHPDGESLRVASHRSRFFYELGNYYIVNTDNYLCAQDVDLEDLANNLGVLRAGQRIAD